MGETEANNHFEKAKQLKEQSHHLLFSFRLLFHDFHGKQTRGGKAENHEPFK
jgi:hypothetical protein